jgi:hypothetical protein
MKYFDIPPGMKVYTLDICEALKGDHDLRPRIHNVESWRARVGAGGLHLSLSQKGREQFKLILGRNAFIRIFA